MPRRGYSNTLEAPVVQYIPGFNEDIAQAQLGQLAGVNKKWDETEQAVSNAIAEYGALPVSDYDRPAIQNKITDFNKYVQDTVGKYGGRYDLAASDIARKMANDAQVYSVAKQRYDLEKQYAPMYAKYAQNLLFKGQDPRKQSIFDAEGKYAGMPDFTPYERSDYSKTFREDVGKLIDDMVYEGKLKPSERAGYLETITKKGIAAIDNPELQKRLSAYVPEFQAKTTFGFDPELQQYKEQPLEFLNKLATYGTTGGMTRDITKDEGYWMAIEEANRRARESEKTPLDLQVMGLPAQDEIENTYLDENPSMVKTLSISGIPAKNVNVKANIIRLERELSKLSKGVESAKKALDPRAEQYTQELYNIAKNDLDKLKSVEPILEKNKVLFERKNRRKPASDYELAEFIDNDSEAVKREYTYTEPVLHPTSKKMLRSTISGLRGAKYRVGNEEIVGSSIADMAKKLKVDEADLNKSLADDNTEIRYNRTSGEYYINVYNSKGKSKKLYFSPDEVTATYSLGLKTLKNAVATGAKEPVVFETPSDPIAYVYDPTQTNFKSDKAAPSIKWINRRTGQPVTDNAGQPIVSSIQEMEDHVAEINNTKLKNVYTKPYLSVSQQRNVE